MAVETLVEFIAAGAAAETSAIQTALALPLPAGLADDDFMFALAMVGDVIANASFTPAAGWVLLDRINDAGNAIALHVFRKIAAAEAGLQTFTLSAAKASIGFIAMWRKTYTKDGNPVLQIVKAWQNLVGQGSFPLVAIAADKYARRLVQMLGLSKDAGLTLPSAYSVRKDAAHSTVGILRAILLERWTVIANSLTSEEVPVENVEATIAVGVSNVAATMQASAIYGSSLRPGGQPVRDSRFG